MVPVVATPLRATGSAIRRNVPRRAVPSIAAASSSSIGTVRKNGRSRMMANGERAAASARDHAAQ